MSLYPPTCPASGFTPCVICGVVVDKKVSVPIDRAVTSGMGEETVLTFM